MADEIIKYEGTVLGSPIVPGTSIDEFATHKSQFGQGGWREVATTIERDAIPTPRRSAGMSVYVTSEKKLYILNSDLTTWSLFSAGGVVDMPIPSETEVGNIVQYIGETTQDYTQGYFYKCVSDGQDPATYSWVRLNVQPDTPVIDSVTAAEAQGHTTDALSANQGYILNERINSLEGRGRYLSTWNCATGLPATNPPSLPYELKPGDYYVVGQVSIAESLSISQTTGNDLEQVTVLNETFMEYVQPEFDSTYDFVYNAIENKWLLNEQEVNLEDYGISYVCESETPANGDVITVVYVSEKLAKRPTVELIDNKPTYNGHASEVLETEPVSVNDTYIFDGTTWVLLSNAQAEVIDVQVKGAGDTDYHTVVEAKVAKIDLASQTVDYTFEGTSVTSVKDALDDLMNRQYYKNPSVSLQFTNDNGANWYTNKEYERRPNAITQMKFKWNVSKTPAANDILQIRTGTSSGTAGTLVYDIIANEPSGNWKAGEYPIPDFSSLNTAKSYHIYYKDNHSTIPSGGVGTANANVSMSFVIKRYYGESLLEALSTDAQIRGLRKVDNAQRALAITDMNFGDGKYWYYVIPKEIDTGVPPLNFYMGTPNPSPLSGNYFVFEKNDFLNAEGLNVPVNIYKFKRSAAGDPVYCTGNQKVKVD